MLRKSFLALNATTATATTSTTSSSGLRHGRPPISVEQAKLLFSGPQRGRWPGNYRPTAGMAAILRKEGIPLAQLIELRKEVSEDRNAELQKDLAYDMNLWTRCSFEQELTVADEKRRRLFRRILTRDRVPTYSEVVQFAKVPSLAGERGDKIEAECRTLPGMKKTLKEIQEEALERQRRAKQGLPLLDESKYPFTSMARLQQDRVFAVLEECKSMSQRVVFPDFPALHNILHHHYDSCSFLKYVAARTGDELLISQEFVRELALYLRRRLEEIRASTTATSSSGSNNSSKADDDKTGGVLFMFSNGRLPHALRESAIPVGGPVIAVNNRRRLIRKDKVLPVLGTDTPASYTSEFPYEILPVVDALHKYKPRIVVGEPHCDRDWTAEMRGYESVREVVLIGQVDSAAMCSFSYPWLSFGCAPSIGSYFAYNSLFQRVNVNADSQFMPMDAPYVQQGYEKLYVDSLSRWMVCSNDMPDAPHQSRCCVFRRLSSKK